MQLFSETSFIRRQKESWFCTLFHFRVSLMVAYSYLEVMGSFGRSVRSCCVKGFTMTAWASVGKMGSVLGLCSGMLSQ